MEVEGVDVLLGDLVVLQHRGVGGDAVLLPGENPRGGPRGGQVLVAVAEALDDPGRLEVREDGQIVGRVRWGEHADHLHPQRVDARQIEDALGGGDHRVAGADAEARRHARAHHALAEHGHGTAGREAEPAELEVRECRPHDGMLAGAKAHVEGDRLRQARFGDADHLAIAGELRGVRLEVEGVQHQLQGTAPGAYQERRRLGPRRELGGALSHQHVEADGQEHDQHDRGDQDGGLDAVVGQVAPGEVEGFLHALVSVAPACSEDGASMPEWNCLKSITRPKRGRRSWSWVTVSSVAPRSSA